MAEISFEDWQKIELKCAKITAVEDVEGKDKLYLLKIDSGSQEKQLVAGIKPYYSKEELQGKTIIVVSNLAPAKIAGLESEGMLLAAKTLDGSYCLLTTDKEVAPGTPVE